MRYRCAKQPKHVMCFSSFFILSSGDLCLKGSDMQSLSRLNLYKKKWQMNFKKLHVVESASNFFYLLESENFKETYLTREIKKNNPVYLRFYFWKKNPWNNLKKPR